VRGQQPAENRAHPRQLPARAFVRIGVEHAPARAARGDDDRQACGKGAFNCGKRGDRHIAAAQSFDHQAARAVVHGMVDEPPVGAHIHRNHIHARFHRVCRNPLAVEGPPHDDHAVFVHETDRAEIAALKRVGGFGVRLGGFGRGDQMLVHRHNHAQIPRLWINGHAHRRPQILRPVPTQFGAVAHCADKDDRLLFVECEVEQVGRFFQRVGAVRDHGAHNRRVGQLRPHRARQFHHPGRRPVRAGQPRKINHLECRNLIQPRNLIENFLPRQRWHGAPCRRVNAHRDRAAREENCETRFDLIHNNPENGEIRKKRAE
jgi:hypothetical protein